MTVTADRVLDDVRDGAMATCPDCGGCGFHTYQDAMGVYDEQCETCRGDCEVEGDADDAADNAYRDGEIRRGL